MHCPVDMYVVPCHSKGDMYQGERNPPSLSGSVQKKNGGSCDVATASSFAICSARALARVMLLVIRLPIALVFADGLRLIFGIISISPRRNVIVKDNGWASKVKG